MMKCSKLKAAAFLFSLLATVLSTSLFSGCSTAPKPIIDFNSDTDFSRFTNFTINLLPLPKSPNDNPILIANIEKSVQKQLLLKKLVYASSAAELTVSVSTKHTEKNNDSSFSIGLGTGRIGRSHSSSISLGTSIPIENSLHYTHVIIDISHNDQPIWHGRDLYESNPDHSPIHQRQLIDATVKRILDNFPPATKITNK